MFTEGTASTSGESAALFCRRRKKGIPRRITTSPIEERIGRTSHRFAEMAKATAATIRGVHDATATTLGRDELARVPSSAIE